MEVTVIFKSDARVHFPTLNGNLYRPHFVIEGINDYFFPMTFESSDLREFNTYGKAKVSFLYGLYYSKNFKVGASFDIVEGSKIVGRGIIDSLDDIKIDPLFSNIQKGVVSQLDCITWKLGDVVLKFIDNNEEYQILCLVKRKIYGIERYSEVTHLHIDKSDIVSFIKEIDDDKKKIKIKRLLFIGWSFEIVDQNDSKARSYYSL